MFIVYINSSARQDREVAPTNVNPNETIPVSSTQTANGSSPPDDSVWHQSMSSNTRTMFFQPPPPPGPRFWLENVTTTTTKSPEEEQQLHNTAPATIILDAPPTDNTQTHQSGGSSSSSIGIGQSDTQPIDNNQRRHDLDKQTTSLNNELINQTPQPAQQETKLPDANEKPTQLPSNARPPTIYKKGAIIASGISSPIKGDSRQTTYVFSSSQQQKFKALGIASSAAPAYKGKHRFILGPSSLQRVIDTIFTGKQLFNVEQQILFVASCLLVTIVNHTVAFYFN